MVTHLHGLACDIEGVRAVCRERGVPLVEDTSQSLGATVGDVLLTPTKIYVKTVRELKAALGDGLHALCHITGGGVPENLPRVLPEGVTAVVDGARAWPAIFQLIAEGGPVEVSEMRRTFNLGIGLVVVVKAGAAAAALEALTAAGEDAWLLGHLAGAAGPAAVRYVHDPEGHRA